MDTIESLLETMPSRSQKLKMSPNLHTKAHCLSSWALEPFAELSWKSYIFSRPTTRGRGIKLKRVERVGYESRKGENPLTAIKFILGLKWLLPDNSERLSQFITSLLWHFAISPQESYDKGPCWSRLLSIPKEVPLAYILCLFHLISGSSGS